MGKTRRKIITYEIVIGGFLILFATCSPDGRRMRAPSADQIESIAIATTVTEPAGVAAPAVTGLTLTGPWEEGKFIDTRYTCKAESISPPLQFGAVPEGTVTLGLALIDLDANSVVHWAVANIAATDTNILEGTVPLGAIQALTAQGTNGYWAPCPPAGQTHRYLMTGYAISQQLEFSDGIDALTLKTALMAASLSVVETIFVTQTP